MGKLSIDFNNNGNGDNTEGGKSAEQSVEGRAKAEAPDQA